MFNRQTPIPPTPDLDMPQGAANPPDERTQQRRRLFNLRDAVQGRRPYRETWTFKVPVSSAEHLSLLVTFIPDRQTIDLDRADRYFQSLRHGNPTAEKFAADLFDDLVCELAPRWLKLEAKYENNGCLRTLTFLERRPDWRDSGLET